MVNKIDYHNKANERRMKGVLYEKMYILIGDPFNIIFDVR